ncbi:MAG: prepilin-type N-terminal cleavage/methylation domain-containing protein [Gemmatimonadales bacterium]
MTRAQNGFTIIEVMVAVLVLTVGLLTLVTTSALVTRMISRGQRSSVAAAWTARQMEQQRFRACTARFDGASSLFRGSTRLVHTTWSWTTAATNTHRVRFITTYTVGAGQIRSDTSETTVSCVL